MCMWGPPPRSCGALHNPGRHMHMKHGSHHVALRAPAIFVRPHPILVHFIPDVDADDCGYAKGFLAVACAESKQATKAKSFARLSRFPGAYGWWSFCLGYLTKQLRGRLIRHSNRAGCQGAGEAGPSKIAPSPEGIAKAYRPTFVLGWLSIRLRIGLSR
jgi:hypothetical protein